jgi:hypothetical protein
LKYRRITDRTIILQLLEYNTPRFNLLPTCDSACDKVSITRNIKYKELFKMGMSWRDLPGRGLKRTRGKKVKTTRCSVCRNETYQKDSICVLCRSFLTRTYKELMILLSDDKKRKPRRVSI